MENTLPTNTNRHTLMMRLLGAFGLKSNTAEGAALSLNMGPETGYWKRVSDLKNLGYVEPRKQGTKTLYWKTMANRDAIVLKITPKGRAALKAFKSERKALAVGN